MNVVIIITYQNVTVSTLKRTVSVCVTVERAQPGMVLICPHTSHCLIWCVCVCVCVCWDHFRGTGLKPDAPRLKSVPPCVLSLRPHIAVDGEEAANKQMLLVGKLWNGVSVGWERESVWGRGGRVREEEYWKQTRERGSERDSALMSCPGRFSVGVWCHRSWRGEFWVEITNRLLLVSLLGYETAFFSRGPTSMWLPDLNFQMCFQCQHLWFFSLPNGHERFLQGNKCPTLKTNSHLSFT